MKLISMSLYGTDPMYEVGARANARLMKEFYPGWQLRIYCTKEVNITRLKRLGCQIQLMPLSREHSGMFWRFLAAWEQGLERVIFRDADSRFNVRETAAVEAWVNSGLGAHCMHDHLHHGGFPILGGLWGVRSGILPLKLKRIISKLSQRPQKRVKDMRFLASDVLPHIKNSLMRHSSRKVCWPYVPFPAHSEFDGFVGQQHTEKGQPIWPQES